MSDFTEYDVVFEIPKEGKYHCLEIVELESGITSDRLVGVHLGVHDSDEVIKALMYCSKAETPQDFKSHQVHTSFRGEMFKGRNRLFIVSLGRLDVVKTTPAVNTFKLFSQVEDDIDSNIIFSEVSPGDSVPGAIVYVLDMEYAASSMANWACFKIMDKKRNVSELRFFSPDVKKDPRLFINTYIVTTLVKKSGYRGFNSDYRSLAVFSNDKVPVSNTVVLCKGYIDNLTSEMPKYVSAYLAKSQFLQKLSIQPSQQLLDNGFDLVRVAHALKMSDSFADLNPEVDVNLLKAGIILSQAYLIADDKDGNLSPSQMNLLQLSNLGVSLTPELLNIIDLEGKSKRKRIEKTLIHSIYSLVDTLLYTGKEEKI